MKGFTDSTKMQSGHNFTRTSVSVPSHQRAMPAKRAMPPTTMSDAPMVDSAPAPSGALAVGLSPTGYAPRMARMTLKQTGKMGVRPPRTSQVEPTDGNENGFAKGGHITAAKRKGLPKSEFGLPGERKYPVDTPGRAANAKARAAQMVDKGKLSESSKAKIDAKADAVLRKARGGIARDPRTPMISPKSGC